MKIPFRPLVAGLWLGLAGAAPLTAQTTILPVGDSITAGGGVNNPSTQSGYRDRLFTDLTGANVSFAYLGINNNYASPQLTNAGDQYHDGFGSFTLADIYSNLAANGNSEGSSPNQGGFWITGGNPTSNGNGPVNRPAVYPNIILLMGGTNDADYSTGNGLAAMETALDNSLRWFAANRPGSLVFVGLPIPFNQTGNTNDPAIDAQVSAYNAWVVNTELPKNFPQYRAVDMNTLFRTSAGAVNTTLYSTDGIHPDYVTGYPVLGDAWYGALQAAAIVPKWQGDGASNTWSVGGPANFARLTFAPTAPYAFSTPAVAYAQGNAVFFDDSGSVSPPVSISGALSPLAVTVNTVQTYTFAGAGSLAGAMTLTKRGTGTLALATNNTYTGGTVIAGGTLQVGAGGTAGSPGTGPVTNNATLAFNRSDTATCANYLTGPGALLQTGPGTTVLTGANDFSGVTTISGGALQVGGGGTAGSLGSGAVVNNASLIFNRSDSFTFYDAVSGTGALTKLGAGTLTLAAPQTYTGPTVIAAGTLKLQGAPALVTSGLLYQLSASSANGYTLGGGNVTSFNDLSGNGNAFTATGTNGPTVLTGSNGINGLTVLHFSGAGVNNKLVLGKTTTPQMVFIVNRPAAETYANNDYGQNGAYLNGIWGQNGADDGIRLATAVANAWQFGSGNGNDYATGTTGSMWINGAPVAANANGPFASASAHILEAANAGAGAWSATGLGSYYTGGNRAFTGDIGEVLAYGTVLGTTDRQAVEAYLNAKWFGAGGGFTVLSASTAVSLTQSGTALDLNGYSQPMAALAGAAGSHVYLGGGTLTVGGNASTTFAGAITDAGGANSATGGGLVKAGGGALTLSGSNSYAGPTQINGGTLNVSGTLNAGGATVTVGNQAVLNLVNGTLAAGTVHVLAGGTLQGSGTVNAVVVNDAGGTVTSGAGQALVFNGGVTNNGLLLFTGGSALQGSGSIVNNGTLDISTGSQTLPAGFVNHGTVLDASVIKVAGLSVSGANVTVTMQSYPGHNYQLQYRADLTAGSWQNLGGPAAGNGNVLSFTDGAGGSYNRGFYRVQVSP